MTNKIISLSVLLLLQCCMFSSVFAQESQTGQGPSGKKVTDLKKEVKSRSGYEVDEIGFGGRASVGKQLYLDDIFIPDRLRFPEFDKSIQPYYEWKRRIKEQHNVQFAQDYTSLFQKSSNSLTDTDSASGGVYRLYGRWLAVGREGKNDGALVVKIESLHKYGSVSPEDFNKNLGYLGSTGTLYSDLGWVRMILTGSSGSITIEVVLLSDVQIQMIIWMWLITQIRGRLFKTRISWRIAVSPSLIRVLLRCWLYD